MVNDNGGDRFEKARKVPSTCIDFERGDENLDRCSDGGSVTKTTSVDKHAHKKRENDSRNRSRDDAGDTGHKCSPQRGARARRFKEVCKIASVIQSEVNEHETRKGRSPPFTEGKEDTERTARWMCSKLKDRDIAKLKRRHDRKHASK